MFDGLAIKAGETATLEGENGEVFHLSQACLSDPRDAGKTYLKIKEGERSLVVCCLQKDKCEHAALDIFVHPATNSFSVEGKNDVHLVGYWEPHGASDSDEDDLDFMADEAEESEAGESDLDDEVPNLLNNERMKKPQGMAALAKAGLDESDEEEDEEQGESDEESMTLPVVAPSKGGKAQAGGVSGNKQKPTQGKPSPAMKAETTPAGKAQPHPAGKAKAAPKPAPKTAAGEAGQKRNRRLLTKQPLNLQRNKQRRHPRPKDRPKRVERRSFRQTSVNI